MPESFADRYHTSLNEIPATYPFLTKDLQTDVAVIGGGIAGAIVLHAFAQAGIQAVLLEKSALGYGASASLPPLLLYDLDLSLSSLTPRMGLRDAVEAMRVLQKAPSVLFDSLQGQEAGVGFSLRQSLCYTSDPDKVPSLRAEYELRSRAGFNVRFLDKDTASQMFSFPVEGGILSQDGCAQVNPYLLLHRLVKDAQSAGALVYENTEVIRMQPLPSSVLLHTSLGKRVQAKRVVLCTGPLAAPAELPLPIPRRIFAVASNDLKSAKGWMDGCVCRSMDEDFLLMEQDNRALLFGESLPILRKKKPFSLRKAGTLEATRFLRLEEYLHLLLPLQQDLSVSARFSGVAQGSSLPYLAPLAKAERIFVVAGAGQNAISSALVGGKLAVSWALGEKAAYAPFFQ